MAALNDKHRNTILVADINHTIRVLVKKYLEDKYQILEAASGTDILSTVFQRRPCDSFCMKNPEFGESPAFLPGKFHSCDFKNLSMIILCLEFPDSHSFEVVRELRKKYHKKCLPIILNTSSNKREIIMEAMETGCSDYIVKPFPRELLISKIHKLERHLPLPDIKVSELISKIPLFSGVPESQVAFILNTCSEPATKEKGELICAQGETNFDLYVLLSGKCDVLYGGKKISEIKPVDAIGINGFVTEQKRSATVVATETSRLIVLKKGPLEQYMAEELAISEIICKNIILSLSERIRKGNELVRNLKNMAEQYLS